MAARGGPSQQVGAAKLVAAEGLGRRQVQRPGPGVAGQGVEDGQLEGQRLARCGSGADHHVATGVGEFGRLDLM